MLSAISIAAISGVFSIASAPLATARNGCDGISGNIQSGTICHVRTETPNYIIDIRYDIDYPDYDAINAYLVHNRDKVINAANAPGAQQLPYVMNVTSESFRSGQPTRTIPEYTQPWHGTLSVALKDFQSVGGAPVGTTYKTFVWDYDKNRTVTFDNLFPPDSKPLDAIYKSVSEQLQVQFLMRHFEMSSAVGHDRAHFQNFVITDDAVIFYFNTGELQIPEAGYYYAPVPRAVLPPLQL